MLTNSDFIQTDKNRQEKIPLHTIELQAHFAFLGVSDTPRRSRTTFRILFRRDFTVFGEIFSMAADPASVSPRSHNSKTSM